MKDNGQKNNLASATIKETETTENQPSINHSEQSIESEVRIFNRNDKLIKKLITLKEEGLLSDKEYIKQLNQLINPAN